MRGFLKDFLIVIAFLAVVGGLSFVIMKAVDKDGVSKDISWENPNIELKLKEIFKEQIQNTQPLIENEHSKTFISNTLTRLTNSLETNLKYEVDILIAESDTVNAFAFPGGMIVINSGLIKVTEEPEEVAAVIAHEIGHISAGDSMEALKRRVGISIIAALSGTQQTEMIRRIIGDLLDTQFTRMQEERADNFALNLLERSKISPGAFAQFLSHLQEASGKEETHAALKYLSTHPLVSERIEKAQKRAEELENEDFGAKPLEKKNYLALKNSIPGLFD